MSTKSNPAHYQFADQLARLEAACTYIAAAGHVMADALLYENRNTEPSYLKLNLAALTRDLDEAVDSLKSLMASMETDLAIEGGKKDTIYPPILSGAARVEISGVYNLPSDLLVEDEPFSQGV